MRLHYSQGSFGLDIPPNIDKILRGWGFSDRLAHLPLAGVVTFMHGEFYRFDAYT